MKSLVVKHSVIIKGRKTSVSLEKEFWTAVTALANERGIPRVALINEIDDWRHQPLYKNANLSSAVRIYIFNELRRRIGQIRLPATIEADPMQPAA